MKGAASLCIELATGQASPAWEAWHSRCRQWPPPHGSRALVSESPESMSADNFKRSIDLAGEWEKPHFRYAKFLDQLMTDARLRQSTTKVVLSFYFSVVLSDSSLGGRRLLNVSPTILHPVPHPSVATWQAEPRFLESGQEVCAC